MPRKKKLLVLGIESIVGNPLDLDSGLHCANCGHDKLRNVINLIQYGFIADTVTEVYRCRSCHRCTSFTYAVEVEITPEGLRYLEVNENV